MKIVFPLFLLATMTSCGSSSIKSKEPTETSSSNSDTSTIDKRKFAPKWIDAITEMADTDDWAILKDDDHFTLVQVLTSRTNRHYILYAKDAEFDINGLAWMKIKPPSCLDIHVYNCDTDKLNFSIKDSYSTDFAFEKLNTFLYDDLLKSPKPNEAKEPSNLDLMTQRDSIMQKYNDVLMSIDSITGSNTNLEIGDEMLKLKSDIRKILNNKNALSSDLNQALLLINKLDKKAKSHMLKNVE